MQVDSNLLTNQSCTTVGRKIIYIKQKLNKIYFLQYKDINKNLLKLLLAHIKFYF